MDKNGDILSQNKWFYHVGLFVGNLAIVRTSARTWNIINKKGEMILQEQKNIKEKDLLYDYDYIRIQNQNGLWNYTDKQGNILLPNRGFKDLRPFSNGFASVQREDGLWNFIDRQGNILSPNMWFKTIFPFQKEYTRVKNQDGQWNYIDRNGQLLSPHIWFKKLTKKNITNGKYYFYIGKDKRMHTKLF